METSLTTSPRPFPSKFSAGSVTQQRLEFGGAHIRTPRFCGTLPREGAGLRRNGNVSGTVVPMPLPRWVDCCRRVQRSSSSVGPTPLASWRCGRSRHAAPRRRRAGSPFVNVASARCRQFLVFSRGNRLALASRAAEPRDERGTTVRDADRMEFPPRPARSRQPTIRQVPGVN
jgi:hypothetical protein